MAAVLVTVFEENKVLCRGRLLWVSDVDMSLLLMLQGLLSTSETSEPVTGRVHSVFKAASAEGICLDAAPDNKFLFTWSLGGTTFASIYAVLRTWRTWTRHSLHIKHLKKERSPACP